MNEKQQQLTFEKGITNVPSDAICSDNALAESVGMVYDDGEHRVIQNPVDKFDVGENRTVLFVHKLNAQFRYVGYETTQDVNTQYKLCWYNNDDWVYLKDSKARDITLDSNNIQITAIGKTLIISAEKFAVTYFLWKDGSYFYLDDIPEPIVEFQLYDWTTEWAEREDEAIGAYGGIIKNSNGELFENQQEAYNNLIIGCYSKLKNEAADKRRFTRPFFIRAAVEMYDGTFTKATNPILLVPSLGNNFYIDIISGNDYIHSYLFSCRLQFIQAQDYSDYSDLVSGVSLFISDQIETLKTDSNVAWPSTRLADGDDKSVKVKYHYYSYSKDGSGDTALRDVGLYCSLEEWNPGVGIETQYKITNCPVPVERDLLEIDKDLKDVSLFYRFADLGRNKYESFTPIEGYATGKTLKTLNTQEQLEDDFFSRNALYPSFLYAYNNRLNLANVSRGYFEGFDFFMPYNQAQSDYKAFVTIATDTKEVTIEHDYHSFHIQSVYFYYPDPRAKHVKIYRNYSGSWKLILDKDLEEHPGLNGAFYFRGLSKSGYADNGSTETPQSPNDNNGTEQLPNYVITSEVSNPFVFKANGYNKAGTGSITAISTITQALSEGQFGQYPLLVFSDDGIWAMSTNNTGMFTSVHPMSREVALADNPCITQTDGAVFFASEKGLMVIVGNQVKCVSEQLSGKSGSPFVEFLRNAVIAYDYRDSLLWIMKPNESYAWVYSIKSGTFSHYLMSTLVPEQASPSPSLQAAPRRSARSSSDTYRGWPVLPFTSTSDWQSGYVNSDFEELTGTIQLYFSRNGNNAIYAGFYVLGSNGKRAQNGWEFNGHSESEYEDNGVAKEFVLFKKTNSTLRYKDNGNNYLVVLQAYDQNHAWSNGDTEISSTSELDAGEDTFVDWVTGHPSYGDLFALRGKSSGNTVWLFDGWSGWSNYEDSNHIPKNTQWYINEDGDIYSWSTSNSRMELLWNSPAQSPISVRPDSLNFAQSGGQETFDISAISSDVSWTISADDANWLSLSSNSGSGNATITVTAAANPGENQRSATLTISGEYDTSATVNITQSGNNPEPPTPTEYSVNVVNDYPDSLIQVDSKVYSLMERVNINNDNGTYSGTIETRPMKLENAMALKSILQVRHIRDMQGTMKLRIFASNNLKAWAELHSLRGKPWLYYKFRIEFSDMPATDRFAGTILITQERRNNKLR